MRRHRWPSGRQAVGPDTAGVLPVCCLDAGPLAIQARSVGHCEKCVVPVELADKDQVACELAAGHGGEHAALAGILDKHTDLGAQHVLARGCAGHNAISLLKGERRCHVIRSASP
jgi:hypothetical protein